MKILPMPGTVWCNKNTTPRVTIDVAGLGSVEVEGVSPGGIVLPFTDKRGDINLRTSLFVVDRMGADVPWVINKQDYGCTLAEAGVAPGIVLAVRAGAGLDQRRTDDYINIKYNEIAAIGSTDDEGPPMYPAPGWVLCEVTLVEKAESLLTVDERYTDAIEQPQAVRMVVVALPKAGPKSSVSVGDVVYMARFTTQDFVEFEDGAFRCVHEEDIIAKEVV